MICKKDWSCVQLTVLNMMHTDSIDIANKATFDTYLKKPNSSSFQLQYTDATSVQKIINNLKPKSSADHDNISSKLLNHMGDIVAYPLSLTQQQWNDTNFLFCCHHNRCLWSIFTLCRGRAFLLATSVCTAEVIRWYPHAMFIHIYNIYVYIYIFMYLKTIGHLNINLIRYNIIFADIPDVATARKHAEDMARFWGSLIVLVSLIGKWLHLGFRKGQWPCFTTVTWHCRKNFSQRERSFH